MRSIATLAKIIFCRNVSYDVARFLSIDPSLPVRHAAVLGVEVTAQQTFWTGVRDDGYVTGAPSSSIVIMARIFMFCVLALTGVWVLFIVGVGMLGIMWGPPCSTGVNCGDSFWRSLGLALAGAGAAFMVGVIGLPVAWRRPSLWIWTTITFVIALGSALLITTTTSL